MLEQVTNVSADQKGCGNMSKEKEFTEKSFDEMDEKERLKFETAVELGLADQLMKKGWKSLSASETGKIGGVMNRKMKEKNQR